MWCVVNIVNETSFSRLRTQGPQTPGKLHEMISPRKIPEGIQYEKRQTTCTSVIPI